MPRYNTHSTDVIVRLPTVPNVLSPSTVTTSQAMSQSYAGVVATIPLPPTAPTTVLVDVVDDATLLTAAATTNVYPGVIPPILAPTSTFIQPTYTAAVVGTVLPNNSHATEYICLVNQAFSTLIIMPTHDAIPTSTDPSPLMDELVDNTALAVGSPLMSTAEDDSD
jgi:hypothetical protein